MTAKAKHQQPGNSKTPVVRSRTMMLDGNGAAAQAIKLAGVGVISAYPITPQSPIAERLSEMAVDGEVAAKYIRVESEHTAMSAAVGAQLTGVRAATATSSVGLALMHEVLGIASGLRVPIVMPVVNRSLVAPWSLWCDHQDTMAERDSGWLQLYAENVQEVFDLIIMSYRIGDDEDVLLPVMVCFDGFFLSHSIQRVEVPDQEMIDAFLPPYVNKNLYLDPADPMFINDLTPSTEFSEMRYQQAVAFEKSLEIIPRIQEEFYQHFGRRYKMVEAHHCDDADVLLVTIGSMAGTAKHVANEMRKQGKKVGVLKILSFRPFPVEIVRQYLYGKKVIGVIDRSGGLGAQGGPLWLEIKAALDSNAVPVFNYVAGLGGRDIPERTIETIFDEMLEALTNGAQKPLKTWIDTSDNALQMRCAPYNAAM